MLLPSGEQRHAESTHICTIGFAPYQWHTCCYDTVLQLKLASVEDKLSPPVELRL